MAVIKPLGLDHVVLRVKDVPLACAWYAAVLGCKVERVLPSLGLTQLDRKSTRLNSSHIPLSRMPSSA